MTRALIAALTLWAGAAGAAEDRWRWTGEDTAWQLTYSAVVVADWGQTLDIASRCRRGLARESNPVLGACPSRGRVNVLIPAAILGHAAVARALPRPYRRYWQAVWLGVEGHAVWRNYEAGFRVRF